MRPRNVKELVGYVLELLEDKGMLDVYAVFNGIPNAVVSAEYDVYRIMLWKDGVKIRVRLKKDTLEPVAITVEE